MLLRVPLPWSKSVRWTSEFCVLGLERLEAFYTCCIIGTKAGMTRSASKISACTRASKKRTAAMKTRIEVATLLLQCPRLVGARNSSNNWSCLDGLFHLFSP
jgi:hypothetical protein